MTPTLFGLIVFAVGSIMLWRASTLAMMRMVLLFSLMGGSAALVLSSLGGSTVQPAIVALGFLVLRCILPGQGQAHRLALAGRDLKFLIVFVGYGVVAAFLLPRLFAGIMDVTPLRPIPNGYIYAAYPLSFSAQNITSAVYLLATLGAAICGHIACQAQRAEVAVARTAAVVAGTHAILGFSSVFLVNTPWGAVLRFFRNGFYAQLDQTLEGIVRMNGIWPETAVFCIYGFTWLVFVTELWLRDVERKWTGPAALLMASALVLSTSSTAYIGLSAYGLILVARLVFVPGSFRLGKALVLVAGGLAALAGILALVVLNEQAAAALAEFAARLTVDKASSPSALQRSFWAWQGVEAFLASSGLGVGPGSFRSSSIVTAIIGSTGIIGVISIMLHLFSVFKPLRRSTYVGGFDQRQSAGAAAGWAAAVLLIPASFTAATSDPGLVWGFFCGISLALRGTARFAVPEQHRHAEMIQTRPMPSAEAVAS